MLQAINRTKAALFLIGMLVTGTSDIWFKTNKKVYSHFSIIGKFRDAVCQMVAILFQLIFQYSQFSRTSHRINVAICEFICGFILSSINCVNPQRAGSACITCRNSPHGCDWSRSGFLTFHTVDDIWWRVNVYSVWLVFFSISILNSRILLNSSKIRLLLANRRCLYI